MTKLLDRDELLGSEDPDSSDFPSIKASNGGGTIIAGSGRGGVDTSTAGVPEYDIVKSTQVPNSLNLLTNVCKGLIEVMARDLRIMGIIRIFANSFLSMAFTTVANNC